MLEELRQLLVLLSHEDVLGLEAVVVLVAALVVVLAAVAAVALVVECLEVLLSCHLRDLCHWSSSTKASSPSGFPHPFS